MIRNNKGIAWTFKNVFSLLISIVGIIAIFSIAYGLYDVLSSQSQNREASAIVEDLVGKIELLEEGESNTFLIRGLKDWYLAGWNVDDSNRPDKCFLESCLCACAFSGIGGSFPDTSKFKGPDPQGEGWEVPYADGEPLSYFYRVKEDRRKDECQNSGVCLPIDSHRVNVFATIEFYDPDEDESDELTKLWTNEIINFRDPLMSVSIEKGERTLTISTLDKGEWDDDTTFLQ